MSSLDKTYYERKKKKGLGDHSRERGRGHERGHGYNRGDS